MNLKQIALDLGLEPQLSLDITGVSIDSRRVEKGELFVALKGERFDGHDFIADAISRGAAAILCEKTVSSSVPLLLVKDSLIALGQIAKAHRMRMNLSVVALTGSNGKTSVKEMIASILPKPLTATKGNLNNHIGVPLTLLTIQETHRYGVFELGANHIGDIAYTVSMVVPDVALINNIAPAHIEGFGSVEGVARAKSEIYAGLKKGGIAVVNADDAYADFWGTLLQDKKVIDFSSEKPATVFADNILLNSNGCASFDLVIENVTQRVHLKVPGRHSVQNALAASACSHALNIPLETIVQGLNLFSGVPGRLAHRQGLNNATIIDDTYNANPGSFLTALHLLSLKKGKRILVLGDMGELGQDAVKHHEAAGIAAREANIEELMTVGVLSASASKAFGNKAKHFEKCEDLISELTPKLDNETIVLVKGSRAARMERVVEALSAKTLSEKAAAL